MDFLNEFSACELVALASIVSISIASNLTESELGKLSAFLTSLGDNLALLALSGSTCNTNLSNDTAFCCPDSCKQKDTN